MSNSPNMIGLYMGLALGLLFLCYMLLAHRKAPEFMQVAIVILSTTGAVMGLHLGYMSLTVADADLGGFSDQRVAIVLGSLAVTWTAVETTVNTLKQCLEDA